MYLNEVNRNGSLTERKELLNTQNSEKIISQSLNLRIFAKTTI